MPFKLGASAVLTALISLVSLAFLSWLGADWARFAPATCQATHCFCELPRVETLVLQPSNSWSSMSFVFVGLLVILMAGRREVSAFGGLPAVWFGLSAIIIGVGSFFLHATLTLWGQFSDVLGMYLLSAFTLTWAFRRWRALGDPVSLTIYVALCGLLVGSLVIFPESRRWLFAVILIADILVELALARPRRLGVRAGFYLTGIGLQAVAFALWILDQSRTVCQADSVLQGHAAWHLLNAAALWASFRYYLSERRV